LLSIQQEKTLFQKKSLQMQGLLNKK